MNLKADLQRADHTGPGGLRCPCCTGLRKRRGGKKNHKATRYVHRKLRREGKAECEKGVES